MPGANATPANGRNVRRQRVLKQGKILLLNGLTVFDCTIRDLSESGARLLCSDTSAIPREFRLALPLKRTMRDAEVKWRKVDELGIRFTSGPRKAPLLKW